MPMLLPLHSVNDPVVITERTNLGNTLMTLHHAITAQEALFTGATPALPVPSQLADINAATHNAATELTTLSGAGYTASGIRDCRDHIRDLCKMVRKAESNMDPYRVEYRRNVVSVADSIEGHNNALMTQALGGKIRRNTARIVNTAPVQAVAAHKGKILGAAGAGAVLWGVLQMEGCSSSEQPPKENISGEVDGAFKPRNKSEDKEGAKYDGEGKSFSVGGFLNASKDTFANGASPEAQAFQGVWNYITKNVDEDNWNPLVERFHFHTTPNKDLKDATHYDVNAYTGDHGTKIIEITWQKEHGKEVKGKGVAVEQLDNHTWRFTLNSNGTIEKTNVYHDGRGEKNIGAITKTKFQEDLRDIQGF